MSSRYSSILVDPYFRDRAGDPTERIARITVAEPHRNLTCFPGHLSLFTLPNFTSGLGFRIPAFYTVRVFLSRYFESGTQSCGTPLFKNFPARLALHLSMLYNNKVPIWLSVPGRVQTVTPRSFKEKREHGSELGNHKSCPDALFARRQKTGAYESECKVMQNGKKENRKD